MMEIDGSPSIRTLVIAPHMDDEALGAGGLIRKRACCGEYVKVLTVFGRKYFGWTKEVQDQRERQLDHANAAREVLGYAELQCLGWEEGEPQKTGFYNLLRPIEKVLEEFHPTEVVIPGRYDLNQDHRHLNEVCRIALRAGNRCQDPQQGPIRRALEMISHDRMMPADADYCVPITDKMGETVIRAWRCYEDEQREHPHPRSVENMWARWRFFGSQFGFDYVEPFRLLFAVD